MAFKGYLSISGNPLFQIDINPSVLYNNSGQYLRVDYNWDILGKCRPFIAGNSPWFSFENTNYGHYWNIGSATGIYDNMDENGSNPYIILDNGTASFYANGTLVETKTYSGNVGSDYIRMFYQDGVNGHNADFYGFKLSDRGGNVLANLVAYTNGIKDEVSGKVYNMTGSGSFIYTPLHTFNPDTNSVRFDQTGGTATVNVEAETTWDITYDTDWFTVVKNEDSVTISAPVNETDQRKEMVITFTDADDFTFTVTVKQKGIQNGMPLHLGELEIPTLYLGSTPITSAYLGEQQVFSNGPFIGLKVTSKVNISKGTPTATIKVKSSEPWSLSIDVDWLTADVTTGDAGTTEITLTSTKTDDEDATAVVTVTAGMYEALCNVKYLLFNENAYLEVVNTSRVYNDTWYVDLDYVPNVDTIIKINTENLTPINSDGWHVALNANTADDNNALRWRFYFGSGNMNYAFGGQGIISSGINMTTKHNHIFSKQGWNCDGTLMPFATVPTGLRNVTTLSVGAPKSKGRSTQGKFGAITICEGSLDNVIHRFIPEVGGYRDADTGVLHPITIVQGNFNFSVGEWS